MSSHALFHVKDSANASLGIAGRSVANDCLLLAHLARLGLGADELALGRNTSTALAGQNVLALVAANELSSFLGAVSAAHLLDGLAESVRLLWRGGAGAGGRHARRPARRVAAVHTPAVADCTKLLALGTKNSQLFRAASLALAVLAAVATESPAANLAVARTRKLSGSTASFTLANLPAKIPTSKQAPSIAFGLNNSNLFLNADLKTKQKKKGTRI